MSTQPWNPQMTKSQAEQHDKRLRSLALKIQRTETGALRDRETYGRMLKEMLDGQGWKQLGYNSAETWLADVALGNGLWLSEVLTATGMARYEFIGRLHDSGMDLADIVIKTGLSNATARADTTKWLARLAKWQDELTNSEDADDELEDDVEPEQVKPRPEARVSEGTTCAADSFEESYRYIREWVKPMLVNPEYQQATRFLKFLDKTRNQLAKYISEVEAEERRRGMHIVA
jgi:hypothetical protein